MAQEALCAKLRGHRTACTETIARLSIYQVPSPDSPFSALVPLALPGTQLLDAMAVIVLDWTRPWDFVSELSRWINMLERAVAQAAGAELRGQTHVEDARAKRECRLLY